MNGILIELTPVVSIAMEVIAGKWGNGEERIKKLKSEGYDAEQIQMCVNDLMSVMERYK
ncbi:MAG: hypothetical protein IKB60_03350 [Clostridia bacterium]|nr:hypothetical protein [Clostridia bacterium]